jgi:hypothetical protein
MPDGSHAHPLFHHPRDATLHAARYADRPWSPSAFGLYPIAICTSCGARWIQDGHQQRAINQVQEPTLFASAAN